MVSQQHDPEITRDELQELVKSIIDYEIATLYDDKVSFDDYKLLINPTGQFVIGGPAGDTGLTGRKIIVDTYGGVCPHGGGAFSGKDPSKVDRSAAYMCRFAAKHLVAAGVADRLCLQVSYAIGKKEPISFMVNTYGTAKNGLTDSYIAEKIPQLFDFTPYGIINYLDLKMPRYLNTARHGHFVTGYTYPWEIVWDNELEMVKKAFNIEKAD